MTLLLICSRVVRLLAKNEQVVVSRLLAVFTNSSAYSWIVSP